MWHNILGFQNIIVQTRYKTDNNSIFYKINTLQRCSILGQDKCSVVTNFSECHTFLKKMTPPPLSAVATQMSQLPRLPSTTSLTHLDWLADKYLL